MIDLTPACRQMITLLAAVPDDQLTNPTPCGEYDLADLIKHIDEAARGFTVLARKDAGEIPAADVSVGVAWRDEVTAHVRDLGQAWDDPEAWQGSSDVGVELSNQQWGRIALTEMVVHGWDVARAIDEPFVLPEETLRACFEHVAEFVPNAPLPELWGDPVEVPDDAPLTDRIVAITGRAP